jgi:hypothetical protein
LPPDVNFPCREAALVIEFYDSKLGVEPMTLSTDQWQAIVDGQAVELIIQGTRCVVIRQDLYERAASMIETNPRQSYGAVLKVLDQFDESPEQYLEYLND